MKFDNTEEAKKSNLNANRSIISSLEKNIRLIY